MADTAVIVPDKQNETFPVTPDQIILQSQITQVLKASVLTVDILDIKTT